MVLKKIKRIKRKSKTRKRNLFGGKISKNSRSKSKGKKRSRKIQKRSKKSSKKRKEIRGGNLFGVTKSEKYIREHNQRQRERHERNIKSSLEKRKAISIQKRRDKEAAAEQKRMVREAEAKWKRQEEKERKKRERRKARE